MSSPSQEVYNWWALSWKQLSAEPACYLLVLDLDRGQKRDDRAVCEQSDTGSALLPASGEDVCVFCVKENHCSWRSWPRQRGNFWVRRPQLWLLGHGGTNLASAWPPDEGPCRRRPRVPPRTYRVNIWISLSKVEWTRSCCSRETATTRRKRMNGGFVSRHWGHSSGQLSPSLLLLPLKLRRSCLWRSLPFLPTASHFRLVCVLLLWKRGHCKIWESLSHPEKCYKQNERSLSSLYLSGTGLRGDTWLVLFGKTVKWFQIYDSMSWDSIIKPNKHNI